MAVTNGTTAYPALSEPQGLFIDGKYQASSDESTFPVKNPMTADTIYECASATVDDYAAAIDKAHAAYATWSRTGPSARRAIFLKAADIVETYLTQDAPDILAAEVSATKSWVRLNIMATAGLLRETAGLVTHIKGEIVPADRPGTTILVERQAVGVVFAISPWNAPVSRLHPTTRPSTQPLFPPRCHPFSATYLPTDMVRQTNLTARAIATPLICGNTVILKPSEFSPKSQHLVVRALTAAGLPPGCLHFLPTCPDRAPAVTEFAVKHPRVLRVNFTGSDRVGRIIAGWAATCLKQCVLELGGKAPVVVLDDAALDDAVEAVVYGGLANAGQICMSTERVIVHRAVMGPFRERLLKRVGELRCGNHLEDGEVTISGLFTAASAARVQALLQAAVDGGARMLAGDLGIAGPNKTIIAPHVLEGVTPEMDIFHKEAFGPTLLLSEFDTDEEAVAQANNTEFSLCASVFSKDIMRAMDVARQIRAGSCHINGPTVYVEAPLPNGGTGGSSGYGRFGGMAGVEEFTERKIITLAKPGMRFAF